MVRTSLVDDEANVRSAAAKAFDILQQHIGVKAIDQTIPTLLEALRQPGQSSGTALQALREVMSVSRLLNRGSPPTDLALGSRINRLPRTDPYIDHHANVRLQCTSFGVTCHCRGNCTE